jgi:excisionase family DNA binding protein
MNQSRIMLTVEEAAESIGIGRTTMFALIKSGDVQSVLIGRLRRVPQSALDDYLTRLSAEQSSTMQHAEGN